MFQRLIWNETVHFSTSNLERASERGLLEGAPQTFIDEIKSIERTKEYNQTRKIKRASERLECLVFYLCFVRSSPIKVAISIILQSKLMGSAGHDERKHTIQAHVERTPRTIASFLWKMIQSATRSLAFKSSIIDLTRKLFSLSISLWKRKFLRLDRRSTSESQAM